MRYNAWMIINSKTIDSSLERKEINKINIKRLIAGFAMLLLGLFLYLFDRRPDQVFFIYAFGLPSLYNPAHLKIFGELSSYLPSLLHVCSFSLLTCAFLPSESKKTFVIACMSWAGVNILFEIGQLITPTTTMLNIPHCLTENKSFLHVYSYFQYGTFDFIDIIFAIIGGLVAYFILKLTITFKGGVNEISSTSDN